MMRDEAWITACGDQFYRGGEPIYLNGIGLGSWLNMEHFMVGIPGTDSQIRETFANAYGREQAETLLDAFAMDYVAEEDMAYLAAHDINLVRVPFTYRLFMDDDGERNEAGYRILDHLMSLAQRHGIYVLLDLHTTPGGQNPDWHSDNVTGYPLFWRYRALQDMVIRMWADIAAYLQDQPYLLGYDVLNEPFIIPDLLTQTTDHESMATGVRFEGTRQRLREFYRRTVAAIREQDTRHIVFLEGDHFASDNAGIDGIDDPQVAMTFHFYPTVWYPDLYEETYSRAQRKAIFGQVMDRLAADAGQTGRPVLCGEAGYEIRIYGEERILPMIEDTIDLFHERGISFTMWSYKDIGFMSMVYPREDTAWRRLADQIRASWDHHRAMTAAEQVIAEICAQGYPAATEQDRYLLAFRARALYYPLEAKYLLQPTLQAIPETLRADLPASFRFDHCDRLEAFADLFCAPVWGCK